MDNFWAHYRNSHNYRPFTLEEAYEIPIMEKIEFTLGSHSENRSQKELFMRYGLFEGHSYIISKKTGLYRKFMENEGIYVPSSEYPGHNSLINMFVFDIWNRDHVKLGRFRHDLFSKLD